MFIYKLKWVKLTPAFWMLLLSMIFTTALIIPTTGAHGTSSGSESGGLALLVFPVAAVLFALFLVFMHRKKGWTVLVTGGGGYVGSVLIPKLLEHDHRVIVLDLFQFGDDIFEKYKDYENFRQINGDFTDPATLATTLRGCDAIIHLACTTGRTNHQAAAIENANKLTGFKSLLEMAKSAGVKRFIFASSLRSKGFGSLPGAAIQPPLEETNEFLLNKEKCEHLLEETRSQEFIVCTIRAAFVYGVAPSQRVDYGINAYTWEGFNKGKINVIGSNRQKIPNIHVEDLAEIYLKVLNQPGSKINGKIYNANLENLTQFEIANTVAAALANKVAPHIEPGTECDPEQLNDEVNNEFGFEPKHSVNDAVRDLLASFQNATNAAPTDDIQYSNNDTIT